MPLPYYLGAPLWSQNEWKGNFYTAQAKAGDFLRQYARFFNAVEGNTTFYATPSAVNVARWVEATPPDFRFSFKFPREITHKAKLARVNAETQAFLKRLAPLGERLNNFMLQLPASFSPERLPLLEQFLRELPTDYGYAVEVRHPAFFTDANQRQRYNELLKKRGVDRVIFESRPVHSAPALDEATREAQERKPRLPVQLDVTAQSPILRYIGHPVLEENQSRLEPWAAQTARWLQAGLTPRIFLHTPNNLQVPKLALQFHHMLQQRLPELPDLPAFPSDQADQVALL
ncbi:MAG: hypothetical protein CR991_07705 [Proteobacteria bacterium]|nr:MAG: hypothetical protein CR991_07705 [Pseudomonadota bacterium]